MGPAAVASASEQHHKRKKVCVVAVHGTVCHLRISMYVADTESKSSARSVRARKEEPRGISGAQIPPFKDRVYLPVDASEHPNHVALVMKEQMDAFLLQHSKGKQEKKDVEACKLAQQHELVLESLCKRASLASEHNDGGISLILNEHKSGEPASSQLDRTAYAVFDNIHLSEDGCSTPVSARDGWFPLPIPKMRVFY